MLCAPVSHHNEHNCSGSVATVTSHQLPPLPLQKASIFPGWAFGMNHRSSSPNSMQIQMGFPFLSIRCVDVSVWPVRWVQVSPFPSSKGSRKEHGISYIATAVSAPNFCFNSFLPLTPRKSRVPCYFFFCFIFLHFKTRIVNACSTGLQKTLKQWSALTSHLYHALTL